MSTTEDIINKNVKCLNLIISLSFVDGITSADAAKVCKEHKVSNSIINDAENAGLFKRDGKLFYPTLRRVTKEDYQKIQRVRSAYFKKYIARKNKTVVKKAVIKKSVKTISLFWGYIKISYGK